MNKFRLTLLPATVLGLVGLALLAFGISTFTNKDAGASDGRDCSSNSVINCGAMSNEEFRTKYNQNASGDLDNIYNRFGLSPGEIDRFASTAKPGMSYKSYAGQSDVIVVDGRIVATGVRSLGRNGGNGNLYQINIDGATYHYGFNSTAFGSNALPVMVMFDENGVMEFAAINNCGNVTWGDVVVPSFSCDTLNMSPVQDKKNTYNFSANVSAANGATVNKVVYDFGDGFTAERTNPAEAVWHTYAQPGKYTAKVTVLFNLPGGSVKSVTGVQCTKPVNIAPEPFYACKALTVMAISKDDHTYRFTVRTNQGNGATLKDASLDFGDGNNVNGLLAGTNGLIETDHTYAKDGDYKIKATVNFNLASNVVSADCTAEVSVPKTPPKECKPGVPIGHPDCKEKPEECLPGVPVGSKKCAPPKELPSTGPAEVLSATLGLGGMAAAGRYYLTSRRNVTSEILKRK